MACWIQLSALMFQRALRAVSLPEPAGKSWMKPGSAKFVIMIFIPWLLEKRSSTITIWLRMHRNRLAVAVGQRRRGRSVGNRSSGHSDTIRSLA
jgi:hypothetical protein